MMLPDPIAIKRQARDAQDVRTASTLTIGSSLWRLVDCPQTMDAEQTAALAALSARSGGRNIFFEEAFQAAAQGRMGTGERRLLLLGEQLGEEERLRLAMPFTQERLGLPPVNVLRAFTHPFAPLSLPLIDTEDEDETLSRFAELLGKLIGDMPLVLEDFPLDEQAASMLVEKLRQQGLEVEIVGRRTRAVLLPLKSGDAAAKRHRGIERFERRLRLRGTVEFERAERVWDILLRFEEFLVLETRGWKGRKGSSIHVIRKTAAFARQAVAALAKDGRAVIYTLRLDGQAIASLIMLRSGNRYYPWKTAFDEAWRSYSPGIQLMHRATRQLLETPGFEWADSLAREAAWVERLWPRTTTIGTLVISRGGGRARRTVAALKLHQTMRGIAKTMLARLMPSPAAPAVKDSGKSTG
jgi:CelD/BcsL family acetyltransferase involved in cellulose biosynthesis